MQCTPIPDRKIDHREPALRTQTQLAHRLARGLDELHDGGRVDEGLGVADDRGDGLRHGGERSAARALRAAIIPGTESYRASTELVMRSGEEEPRRFFAEASALDRREDVALEQHALVQRLQPLEQLVQLSGARRLRAEAGDKGGATERDDYVELLRVVLSAPCLGILPYSEHPDPETMADVLSVPDRFS